MTSGNSPTLSLTGLRLSVPAKINNAVAGRLRPAAERPPQSNVVVSQGLIAKHQSHPPSAVSSSAGLPETVGSLAIRSRHSFTSATSSPSTLATAPSS